MTDSILIFARSTPHHRTGGMETVAWALAAEWARTVRDVRVVTTAIPRPPAPPPFVEDGVRVVPLPGTRPGEYSPEWWEASRAYWASLPTPPEVVLSVSAGAYGVVRDRAKFPHVPFVMQAHGTSAMEIGSKLRAHDLRSLATSPKNMLGLAKDLARYRDFDAIVAIGENVAQSLAAPPQSWSVPPERIRLIPNGVRPEDHGFDPASRARVRGALGLDESVSVIASIGRLHVQKRVDRALRAAAVLRNRGLGSRYAFLIVGDGPEERKLHDLARELRLESIVRFTGRVHKDEVRAYYAAADVALLTTARLEGLPMAVLEALACGLPSVVPTGSLGTSRLDRVVREADPADAERLADVLIDVTGHRGARASLLPEEFTLAHSARSYLTAFQDLVPVP
ncbi:glycosyltransferase family 4 protein [Actinoplanes sp. CA-030573]|uniref:glycosyltransferase family 4 protein n=1 Tax=Actinoplanes sp. CA-030573 TaxID=3239898 RepID=UPI003D905215